MQYSPIVLIFKISAWKFIRLLVQSTSEVLWQKVFCVLRGHKALFKKKQQKKTPGHCLSIFAFFWMPCSLMCVDVKVG